MKALSLWQPWATAIALGHKSIETRGWPTNYRGPVAIHAAKKLFRPEEYEPWFTDRLLEDGIYELHLTGGLPYGAIVAIAHLTDCRLMNEAGAVSSASSRLSGTPISASEVSPKELDYGNWADGRFAWQLTDVVALARPIPYRGAQGLFEIPDEILIGSEASLARFIPRTEAK